MSKGLNLLPTNRNDRGFALLVVLWTLALLSFVVMQMVVAARSEGQIASNLRANMAQEFIADGAVYAAAFHLLNSAGQHWSADGSTHNIAVPGGAASVRITDESNKVNLNTASPDLLRAVLLGVGADSSTASDLAQAIVEWRDTQGPQASAMKAAQYRAAGLDHAPPEEPFRSLGELSLVLGMTPGLVTRIMPHLTLYSSYGPDQSSTDPVARDAIMLLRKEGGVLPFIGGAAQEKVVQIVASAIGVNGARFTRRAILRIDPRSEDQPYAVLVWRS